MSNRHLPSLTLAAGLTLAVFACLAPARASADPKGKTTHKWLNTHFAGTRLETFYGGLHILAGDTVRTSVIVISGALDIQGGGVLDGNAWVIDGEVILSGDARVTGTVDVVNGEVYQSRAASVDGSVRLYDCECKLDAEAFDEDGTLHFVRDEDPQKVRTGLVVSPGFPKRVNYDIFRIGLKRQNDRHRDPYVRGHLFVHVPMWGKYYSFVGWDGEVLIPAFGTRFDFIIRGYKQAATTDYWMMPRGETTLDLVVMAKDYPDYFEQRGGQVGLNYRMRRGLRIEPLVTLEEDLDLETKPSLTIAQNSAKNRSNPDIDDGTRLAVSMLGELDTRGSDKAWPRDAWLVQLWAEKGLNEGPGEFSYLAFYTDVRWYNKLPMNFQWDMRARMFSTADAIPRQSSQSLNGFAGIRGTGDQPFAAERGDRLFLFSSEWRYWLPETPIVRWVFTQWNVLLFTDIGLLAEAKNPTAPLEFLKAPFDEWRKSAGVGISGESFFPYLGIYLAKDLDHKRDHLSLILRINRSF